MLCSKQQLGNLRLSQVQLRCVAGGQMHEPSHKNKIRAPTRRLASDAPSGPAAKIPNRPHRFPLGYRTEAKSKSITIVLNRTGLSRKEGAPVSGRERPSTGDG